jgi:hypothetical protein
MTFLKSAVPVFPVEIAADEHMPTLHSLDPSLPDGFPLPVVTERPYEIEVFHVGSEGWTGYYPPEDSALQPQLQWTEAHRILVLAAYNQEWGRFLEEGQSYEIVWPPTAHLYDDGHVVQGEENNCSEHDEWDCVECEAQPPAADQVNPAEWRWIAEVETYEEGCLEDVKSFHFMSTYMDPRDVDYRSH